MSTRFVSRHLPTKTKPWAVHQIIADVAGFIAKYLDTNLSEDDGDVILNCYRTRQEALRYAQTCRDSLAGFGVDGVEFEVRFHGPAEQ